MVLSANTSWRSHGSLPARVWGLAGASEVVTLSGIPAGASVLPSNPFTADASGAWSITVSSAPSPSAVNLTFAGSSGQRAVLSDVLFGLTVLCSGQSNMDMDVGDSFYANETLANKGAFPTIRLKRGTDSAWARSSASNATLSGFSAVCYFSAMHMQLSLPAMQSMPVGLVQASVGGTTIETWMSSDALLAAGYPPANATCGVHSCAEQANCANYIPNILPYAPFTFGALLWYQGEANVGCNAAASPPWWAYRGLLISLVDSWRALFASPFPAYIFQLAPFGSTDATPPLRTSDALPRLRAAQASAASALNNAEVMVNIDMGDDGVSVYTPPSYRHGGIQLSLIFLRPHPASYV
jgi:hypothetical protein